MKTSARNSKQAFVRTLHAQSDSIPPGRHPTRHPNTKRIGELAEAAFIVKAAGLGFAVSKPWGDSERYDFILDSGLRTWRVQIKCTQYENARGYQVQSTYCDRKKKGHYTAADIDVLVAYILPLDLWYVIPAEAFPSSASIRFYPEGNISRRARFEQYREAWDLFQKNPPPDTFPESRSPNDRPPYDRPSSNNCHPEQREGPAVVDSVPDAAVPPEPETVLDRVQRDWAKRVTALYSRKN